MLGTSACRGREDQGTPACHTAGWNSPDFDVSGRTFMDILHPGNNQWSNQKNPKPCRCQIFYHLFHQLWSHLQFGNSHQKFQLVLKKGGKKKGPMTFGGMCSYLSTFSYLKNSVPLPSLRGNLSPSSMALERLWHQREARHRKGS